jgi:hypothetical protein
MSGIDAKLTAFAIESNHPPVHLIESNMMSVTMKDIGVGCWDSKSNERKGSKDGKKFDHD